MFMQIEEDIIVILPPFSNSALSILTKFYCKTVE